MRLPENLGRVDQRVYDGLRSLPREKLACEMDSLLRESEITGLLARRDGIVQFFETASAEKGEGMVVCKLEGH